MITVGQHVRKVNGRADLGREGVVTAVSASALGGDVLVTVDGAWSAYDRQLEIVDGRPQPGPDGEYAELPSGMDEFDAWANAPVEDR